MDDKLESSYISQTTTSENENISYSEEEHEIKP